MGKTMKIYIVTSGEYSDYHIVGVFLMENEAEEFAHKANGEVETYVVDELAGAIKRKNYRYSLPEGKGWSFDVFARPDERVSPLNSTHVVCKYKDGWGAYGDSLVSFEHAKKLAVEKVQKAMREEKL